jgi:hypothetical protein
MNIKYPKSVHCGPPNTKFYLSLFQGFGSQTWNKAQVLRDTWACQYLQEFCD